MCVIVTDRDLQGTRQRGLAGTSKEQENGALDEPAKILNLICFGVSLRGALAISVFTCEIRLVPIDVVTMPQQFLESLQFGFVWAGASGRCGVVVKAISVICMLVSI